MKVNKILKKLTVLLLCFALLIGIYALIINGYVNTIFEPEPKYLGEAIPIQGDGNLTQD